MKPAMEWGTFPHTAYIPECTQKCHRPAFAGRFKPVARTASSGLTAPVSLCGPSAQTHHLWTRLAPPTPPYRPNW